MTSAALDAIRDVVREQFGAERVVDVRTRSPEPYEDVPDEIVRVTVVYDGESLDPAKMLPITRLARDRLAGIDDDMFPLFSFVSRADDEQRPAQAH